MSDIGRAAAPAGDALAAAELARTQLLLAVFVVAALNSVAGHVLRSISEQGWIAAVASLFGVSAIIWTALAAAASILVGASEREPVRRGDVACACAVAALALMPFATASMVALALASLWALCTSPPGSALRRAALILLTVTGALLWGRLFLAVFSRPLLDLDALFVAALIGADHQGNMLWFDGATHRLVVAPGCSSMQGLSLAFLFWVTINQYFSVRFGRRQVLVCLAALAATIAINVLRIGAMLRFPQYQDEIHVGWGYQLSMWATLLAVALICLTGARREIFNRP